jgi:hypothetical protein
MSFTSKNLDSLFAAKVINPDLKAAFSLKELVEISHGTSWQNAAIRLRSWTYEFLDQHHVGTGRLDPVCPRISSSDKKSELLILCGNSKSLFFTNADSLGEKLAGCFADFASYRSTSEAALILVGSPNDSPALRRRLYYLQRRIKAQLVRQGLISGTFSKGFSTRPSEAGIEGWPPHSPIPIFVIRSLRESDKKFIVGQPRETEAFKTWFRNNQK